jgi:cytoskeletal protein CcmA (bactofilin family)
MSFFSSRRQSDAPPSATEERSQSTIPALPPQPVGFETVLGANCVLEGKLSSKTNVRLDGTFTGTLEIDGNVLVGETAKITADIHARNVSIAGAVHGNVSGKKVQLLRTGRIWGDIQATALTTEEGAFIDGKITMMSHDAAAPEVPAAPEETTPELVNEIAPIIEEAQERGINEADVLSESDMAAEGGIPDEVAKDRTEGN